MAGVTIIVGDPGSGKTSFMFRSLQEHILKGWTAVIVSNVDARRPPLGTIEARDLSDAVRLAGDKAAVIVGYDEIRLEVSGQARTPSAALDAIARFRRHMQIDLIATTQRPHDLPPAVRDLDVHYRFLRFSDTSSYTYAWIEREYPDIAGRIPYLEPYYWTPTGPEPVIGKHYLIAR